ncbi:MAG: hypothetical protein KAT00_04850 [Planctomycetes bacterium]|nr:hypothetical protein [Planctomycetota bacterium]
MRFRRGIVILPASVIILMILCAAADAAGAVEVTVRTNVEKWTISEYLTGLHFVYSWNADEIYADGDFANWANSNNVNTARFPGGTASYWNWENPTGRMGTSSLDPGWDGVVADPNKWMDIDEYLSFCSQSGMTPLMGVNYASCIKYSFPVQESVDRSARQVRYLKDRGFGGAFWYIGNEDLGDAGGRVPNAANLFVQHAEAMKAVDPNITIFWNDNAVNAARLHEHLAIVGGWADGVEFHGKWPYGGNPDGFGVATFEEWKAEVPIIDRKAGTSGRTWREKIAELRTAAMEAGYPNLLMANNEYGLNGSTSKYYGFNKYTKGLVVVDFLQEMFIAGYDMACFWATVKSGDHKLMDKSNNYRMNPMHFGFELLATAQGATMIDSDSTHPYVYGFAAKTPCDLQLYLLNKTETDQPLEVRFVGLKPDATIPQAESMVDTADHWGAIETLAVTYDDPNDCFKVTLGPLSYTRIIFDRDLSQGSGTVFDADLDGAVTEENTTAANLEIGTDFGSWSNFPAGSVHIRSFGADKGLLVDQVSGGFDINCVLSAPVIVDGTAVSFKAGIRRTVADHTKDITIAGLDTMNNKSFKVVLTAVSNGGPAGEKKRMAYVGPSGGLTIIPEGSDNDLDFIDDTFDPAELASVTLTLTSAGYVVDFAHGTTWRSQLLPYSGLAEKISKLRISGSSTAGIWLDEIRTSGLFWPPGPADINADGLTNISDLKVMGLQWLQSPTEPSADIAPVSALDNFIDLSDLGRLMENWLDSCCPQ